MYRILRKSAKIYLDEGDGGEDDGDLGHSDGLFVSTEGAYVF